MLHAASFVDRVSRSRGIFLDPYRKDLKRKSGIEGRGMLNEIEKEERSTEGGFQNCSEGGPRMLLAIYTSINFSLLLLCTVIVQAQLRS
jgi:hypothetical protein